MRNGCALAFVVLCLFCAGIRPLEANPLLNRRPGHSNAFYDDYYENSAMGIPESSGDLDIIPLDLSPDSVDDMYFGCSEKMLAKVNQHYFPDSTRDHLQDPSTERCAKKLMKRKDKYDQLSLNHFRALCAYTLSGYEELNEAVRTGKASYNTSFDFHVFHFLLSDAIRLLKANQDTCYTTYRRNSRVFSGESGQTMRFGGFGSSSLKKNLVSFGRKTCFKIHTCFGAYLKSYSQFGTDEQEVLIPPYEMFTIVSVDKSGNNNLGCEVVYKLETAGVHSNLNCKAVDNNNNV